MIRWEVIDTNLTQPILILNDKVFNPIEVMVLCNNTNTIKRNFSSMEVDRRKFRIISFKQLGITSDWEKDLFARANKLGQNISSVSEADIEIIKLLYSLCICIKPCWISRQLIKKKSTTEDIFRLYIEKYSYNFDYKRIKNFSYVDKLICNKKKQRFLLLKEILLLLWNKIVEKSSSAIGDVHQVLTKSMYTKSIEKEHPNWMINCQYTYSESNSGCIFLTAQDGSKRLFIKGNENPVFESIKNEIHINQLLKQDIVSNELFLLSYNSSKRYKWIAFPFIDGILLSIHIKRGLLNKRELGLLASFLFNCLDCLSSHDIIHRDIRSGNIMCIINKEYEVESFRLIDFGCSVFKGNDIWGDSIWDRHMASVVCGENRYNDLIVDDAASAYLTYIECGGDSGDIYSKKFLKRIGVSYYMRR
ncbi:hypothetical protein MCJ35_00850 [Enterocloster sp. OA13]|uniref:protein kinase domain-containing protein n=1 Tax=Enterocloster sp. OA13 TaxID=2914161 RepID=UPI001F068342|nr:hypothetical protein [Enterocloster sp. OA13]